MNWVGETIEVTTKVPLKAATLTPAMTTLWPTAAPLGPAVVIEARPPIQVAKLIGFAGLVWVPPVVVFPGLSAKE